MNPIQYFDPFKNKITNFLLNFKSLHSILVTITTQRIYELPYPTPLEFQSVNPLSEVLLNHINYVIVTYPNIHKALIQLVPSIYPNQTHFWARYFKLLFLKTNNERKYHQFIRSRIQQYNQPLKHILHLQKWLLKEENINWGKIPLDSGISFFAVHSHCYEYMLENPNVLDELIDIFVDRKENVSKAMIKKNWLTENKKDVHKKRLRVILDYIYTNSYIKLYYLDELIDILLYVYEFERVYLIVQSFLLKSMYHGIYPYTNVQFDGLVLALNSIIKKELPEYYSQLNHQEVNAMTVLSVMLKNMLFPLISQLSLNDKLLFLGSLLTYGYPFALNIIIVSLKQCKKQPITSEDIPAFITFFTEHFYQIITITWQHNVFQHIKYYYTIPFVGEHEFPSFFDTEQQYHQLCFIPCQLPSDMLTIDQSRELNAMLPYRYRMMDFEVLFSSSVNGKSLTSLFYHCGSIHPLIVLIRSGNKLFGAFTTDTFDMSSKYHGTGETFLFSLTSPKKYAATMKNNYFVFSKPDRLSFGSGNGVVGLGLDQDFNCWNYSVETFDNELFMNENIITVDRVEIWTVGLSTSCNRRNADTTVAKSVGNVPHDDYSPRSSLDLF